VVTLLSSDVPRSMCRTTFEQVIDAIIYVGHFDENKSDKNIVSAVTYYGFRLYRALKTSLLLIISFRSTGSGASGRFGYGVGGSFNSSPLERPLQSCTPSMAYQSRVVDKGLECTSIVNGVAVEDRTSERLKSAADLRAASMLYKNCH
jgi:hypothetical protein